MEDRPLEVSTRPTELTDADRIATLMGVLGYPSTPDDVVSRLPVMRDRPDHASWVAESGGTVVGYQSTGLRFRKALP